MGWFLPALLAKGITAAGDAIAGNQQKKAAYREAGILDLNATQAETAAARALVHGDSVAATQFGDANKVLGEQTTIAAGTGLDMGFGVTQGLFDSTSYMGDLNSRIAKRNAQLASNDLLDQAKVYREKAKVTRENGRAAQVSGLVSGASSLAVGGLQLYSDYLRMGTGKGSSNQPKT